MPRFQTDAANEQINPLLRTELAAALAIICEIKAGELDRPHILNPERTAFPLGILIVQMADVHLRPDTAHEHPVVFADIAFWNVDISMTEIDEFGPVFVVVREVAYLHLID